MLHRYCSQFFAYCQLADFSVRSIQALTIRLNEFKAFLKFQRIRSVLKITCRHLINLIIIMLHITTNHGCSQKSPGYAKLKRMG